MFDKVWDAINLSSLNEPYEIPRLELEPILPAHFQQRISRAQRTAAAYATPPQTNPMIVASKKENKSNSLSAL